MRVGEDLHAIPSSHNHVPPPWAGISVKQWTIVKAVPDESRNWWYQSLSQCHPFFSWGEFSIWDFALASDPKLIMKLSPLSTSLSLGQSALLLRRCPRSCSTPRGRTGRGAPDGGEASVGILPSTSSCHARCTRFEPRNPSSRHRYTLVWWHWGPWATHEWGIVRLHGWSGTCTAILAGKARNAQAA